MKALSVVICTHDPQVDYLNRVLQALRNQTLPLHEWQLLIVDNASPKPISELCDISWHPDCTLVTEDNLGVAFARRRGIIESYGEIVVFVDDDNLLAPDYLSEVQKLMNDVDVGVVGGASTPEFETDVVPPYFYNFATWLACGAQLGAPSNVSRDVVDLTKYHHIGLFTAGLALRRADGLDLIRLPYFPSVTGRKGDDLSGGEDYEICHLIALKGKRILSSSRLQFRHIISESRLDSRYLEKLVSSTAHRRRIQCYVAARQYFAGRYSVRSLLMRTLKHLVMRRPHLAFFELALSLNIEAIAKPRDRVAFRNVIAAKGMRL